MHSSRVSILGALALVVVACAAWAAPAGDTRALPAAAERQQLWSARGGTVGLRWNRDLAGDIGLTLSAASGRHPQLSGYEHEVFDLQPVGSLDFDVRNGNLRSFLGGTLQARGGYQIESASGRIDLNDFRLVPRRGAVILDLVGSDGDPDPLNDWVPDIRNGRIYWAAATRGNTLNWGTMFRFGFIVNQAPAPASATMHIAADSTREVLEAPGLLAPVAAARGAGLAKAR